MTAAAQRRMPTRERRFTLAPFGTYTRIQSITVVRHIATVIGALMIIALTLDLASQVERVLAKAPVQSLTGRTFHVLWYIVLRSADLIGSLLPLGCFLGTFWAEVTQTQSRERLVVWNGGRTPLQGLMPLLLIGGLFGVLQTSALMWFRPAAVAHQIAHGIGSYGERFDRRLQTAHGWITLDNHLIRARIDYANRRLVDLDIYKISFGGRLVQRIQARSAEPGPREGEWLFREGSRWVAQDPNSAEMSTGEATWFTEATLPLPLDPLWLASSGIEARFLPQATLASLGEPRDTVPDSAPYATWEQARLAQGLLPFGMMALASALSMLLIPFRHTLGRLIAVGLTGYFLHVTVHSILWLGGYGRVPAIVAGWAVPLACIAVALTILYRLAPPLPPVDRRPGSVRRPPPRRSETP
jgi:lipopolysaccharide export system permease protein